MSDIVKILPYRVDLGDTLSKTELHTIFVMSESLAHRFEIEIKSGGKDVDLSGRTVTASFTNFRENTTIEMIGEVKDGKAVVTLERPCYTLRGQFVLIVMIQDGDADVAVFLGEGHMRTSRAEKIIYDDYIVMDTDALLAHIAAMKSATNRANTAADRVERMQIDASGLAGDANRLGGKPPEYYIQPVNLLDNSNFEIAQAGHNGLHGNETYLADRWVGSTEVAFNNRRITFTADYATFTQRIGADVRGKICTFAVKARNVSGIVNLSLHNGSAVSGPRDVVMREGITTLTCYFPADSNLPTFVLWGYAGTSFDVEWTAAYEGAYTAETLPPYVPKGYVAELAECRRYYRKEKINCLFVPTYSSILDVLIVHDDMYALPTVTVINAKFMNTDLEKWEQWVWTDITSLYRSAEFGKRSSIWAQFVDDSYPFITKTNYRGEIEYEASADL